MPRRYAPVLLLLLGCTSFQGGRPVESLPQPLATRQRVEVWTAGERYQLHAVTMDADSLRGVRWWHSPDCDSSRVVLPRAAVDSVRTLAFDSGESGVLALILTPIIFFGGLILLFVVGASGGT